MKSLIAIFFAFAASLTAFSQAPPLTIDNNRPCDVFVTVYCGNDIGCTAACSTSICIPANTLGVTVNACSIDCWYWSMAIVCPVTTCPMICGGADADCAIVSWVGCMGHPTNASANVSGSCPCPWPLNVNANPGPILDIN